MNDIQIAFFFHDTDYYSGATRSLIDLIDNYINNKKTRIILVFPSNKGSAIDYYRNKDVCIITSHYYQVRKDISESFIQSLIQLPKRLNNIVKSFFWCNLKTLPLLKKNNIDLIYINTSFNIAGYWMAKKMKVPVLAHFREFGEEDHKITIWFGRKKYYKIVQNYSHIICISEALKAKYKKFIDEKKISVVYDDISNKYINWDRKLKDISKGFNILIAGNIISGKGQLKVIKAILPLIKNNSKIKIYMAGGIGDRDYYDSIIKFVEENKIKEKIIFLGLVKDMNSLREKMHIGIVASDMEAFGRVTIEGMLSGMLMIGTNQGGTSELISDKKNGFLVDKNLKELNSIIYNIVNNYNDYYEVLLNAFDNALEYTKGNCAKNVLKVIEKEIENGKD